MNDTFEKFIGVQREVIIGKHVTEIFPNICEGSVDWIEKYKDTVLYGKNVKFEEYFQPFDKWLRISAYKNKKDQLALVFEDITDSKKAEQQLIESEKRFRLIIENIPTVVWSSNENGGTSFLSSNVEEVALCPMMNY